MRHLVDPSSHVAAVDFHRRRVLMGKALVDDNVYSPRHEAARGVWRNEVTGVICFWHADRKTDRGIGDIRSASLYVESGHCVPALNLIRAVYAEERIEEVGPSGIIWIAEEPR